MNEQNLTILKKFGIKFEKGLTCEEIIKIEEIYEIKFHPQEISFSYEGMPISINLFPFSSDKFHRIVKFCLFVAPSKIAEGAPENQCQQK